MISNNGDKILLDVLNAGSIIGQYSVLYEEPFIFSAVAKSSVRLLLLE